MEKKLTVKGMSCGHCQAAVTKAVQTVDGVENVTVDLATGRVTYSSAADNDAKVKESIENAGYEVAD